MKQTDKNIYRLKLKCEKCGKDIHVCFDINIKEIPDYGPEESYKPTKIPKYLRRLLKPEHPRDEHIFSGSSISGLQTMTGGTMREDSGPKYLILCRKCEKIENIKE